MKTIVSLLTLVVLLYLFAALAMYLLQRKLIYHPTPTITHPYKDRQFTVDADTTLRVIEANPNKSDAVLYFGGNAELVAGTAPDLAAALPDKTLYLVNYRGYSGSDGTPTEAHLFNDAEKIFDTINKLSGANHQSISVIGRSLGSGIACYLASRRPVSRLVLITPFDSILNLAQSAYPIFPVRWLLKDHFNSVQYAPSVTAPVLALLAQRDGIIPTSSSEALMLRFSSQSETLLMENVGHNDVQLHPDFHPAISDFLNR